MSAKLSGAMLHTLRAIKDSNTGGGPGRKKFSSGWPTMDALRNRGLITIGPDPGSRISCIATITAAGLEALLPKAHPYRRAP